MQKPAKLLFFGNERIATAVTTATPTLRKLIEAGYDIAAVVSHHESTRSRNARELEIATLAAKHDIPVLLPSKPAEIIDQIAAYEADAAVLVAYGKIVPQSIIDLFPCGIINIHPSLLPLHRGPIPIESVILEGTEQTGVSVMRLARAMDAGPVYGQTSLRLGGDETKQQLADTLLEKGGDLLLELLPHILDGTVSAEPQDDNAATYDALLTKDDASLDFTNKSADRLSREVRAYLGWPGSRTTLAEKDVVITVAHAAPDSESSDTDTPGSVYVAGKQLGIYCRQGILMIDELKPAGKQAMPAAAFLAGYGNSLR